VETIYIYATLGTFLGSFFWGVISDAFGRKWAMVVCLLLSLMFILARAVCTSLAWLPALAFSSCLANGSLVVVKAYAGDILDSANSATGFVILGVCSICINAAAVVGDLLLYALLPHSKGLLLPSVVESACILVALGCVQVFLVETIRVRDRKPTSPPGQDQGQGLGQDQDQDQGQGLGQSQVEMATVNRALQSQSESQADAGSYDRVVSEDSVDIEELPAPSSAAATRALPPLGPTGIMKKSSGVGAGLAVRTTGSDDFDDEPVFFGDGSDDGGAADRFTTPPPPRSLSPTPSSPLRRNVSFSGLVTVKVIGKENLAVGRLKTLPFDEKPLSSVASDGVAPRNAPSGVVGGSARGLQRSSSLDALAGAGGRKRALSPLVEDATSSGSSSQSSGGIAMGSAEAAPAADADSNDILREYCGDSDDYLDAFCGEEDRGRDQDRGRAGSRSSSSTFRAATQLLSTFGSLRYANGAEFYEAQLREMSSVAVVAKTLRSLLMRNAVLLSTALYASNLCVVTAVSLSCPVWLMYHAPAPGEDAGAGAPQPGEKAAYDPVRDPSGLSLAGDDVIFIVAVSFVLSVLLMVKFFAMSVRNWKVVFCYRLGVRITVAGVLLVPTIYSVQQVLRVPFYAYLYVIAVFSLISLGSMWSLMATILMVNNSGYKWERGTVFGLAETVGCVGKLGGVLISRYMYDVAVHSRQKWPFDAAAYWYGVALLLYSFSGLAACLPKSILVRLCSTVVNLH
jgi:MFS family permease